MTPRRRRMLFIGCLLLGLAAATALMLKAFEQNLLYFYSPSQVMAGEAPEGQRFRLGGLVKYGSVKRAEDSLDVQFVLADCEDSLPVTYRGILPDLFREGQGIVAYGQLSTGQNGRLFVADEVLAKHDENYMSPEVAESLKKPDGASCMPPGMLNAGNREN